MTSPLTTAPALSQEIAWSRNAPTHLALLQQSALAGPEPGSARRPALLVSPVDLLDPRPALEEPTPSAQAPAADGSQQSRFLQVDVVLVDAIVMDASGQPVLDLGASDFKVFESSVEQAVVNVAVVKSGATSYYLLGYRSTTAAPPGSFRRIEVRVDRPGVWWPYHVPYGHSSGSPQRHLERAFRRPPQGHGLERIPHNIAACCRITDQRSICRP